MNLMTLGVDAVERGLVPDTMTRAGIRRLCRQRLDECATSAELARSLNGSAFVRSLRNGPIALVPEKANEQHYELPPEFFEIVLGPHRKYSCCYWDASTTDLARAEELALEITCARAELRDGQTVLELGCGWGSLSLWMAAHYRHSRIVAVSNSAPQREFILTQARERGLDNLDVITADMNEFAPILNGRYAGPFDRVVSVEMFEHMRNYEELLARIAGWLGPAGKLFVHIFTHREFTYPFDSSGTANWMGRYFFTGGLMPSVHVLREFARDLVVSRQWSWNGRHYAWTADAWLANLDRNVDEALAILKRVYGERGARRWWNRWRMFFLAVSEVFAFRGGQEWFVSHYLLEKAG